MENNTAFPILKLYMIEHQFNNVNHIDGVFAQNLDEALDLLSEKYDRNVRESVIDLVVEADIPTIPQVIQGRKIG